MAPLPKILRARTVVPGTTPVLSDGAVRVADGRIIEIGPWADLSRTGSAEVVDLGDSVLLPGLINAHCHLDYTRMAGLIPPTKSFSDWVKSITALKADWSYTEYAHSWLSGANMLLATGTTTVADIEAVPELLPEVWNATPLRVYSFLEMTGVRAARNPVDVLREALTVADALNTTDRHRIGLSPHALYSTRPQLLHLTAKAATERGWRYTTHVAESFEEFEMYTSATGPLHSWMQMNERDLSDCGDRSPVQQLARLNYLSETLLAVHVNHLAPGDAELLASHGVHVVHCPCSHDYFRHDPFPFHDLSRAGVNVCLGTDSLITVRGDKSRAQELNMFTEMQLFANKHPDMDPAHVLSMATANSARALGLQHLVGDLTPGKAADLIAVPFSGPTPQALEMLVHEAPRPVGCMIDGKWITQPAA